MRYLALACDYDGTLAKDGRVDEPTRTALRRFVDSGRRLILVTGRQLDDLATVFPYFELFERIVAENGALLYRPASREEKQLTIAPPSEFVDALRSRGVGPVAVGRVVVATWQPHETTVLETIHEFGLDLQIVFNKGAVMVLPSGVNKATGLAEALGEMGLSPHNTIGVGDAENDHAFLRLCECGVAVQNALPMVKETADIVTRSDHGAGVTELIDRVITDDLRSAETALQRHNLLLGTDADGRNVDIPPYGSNLLIAGASGGGKSTLATGFLEQLVNQQYQFCVVDPEGDYETLPDAVALGTPHAVPQVEEVLQLLMRPDQNVVVNLVGLSLEERPNFFHTLLPRLQGMRAKTGRPHWIIVDEAHHLAGAAWDPAAITFPRAFVSMLFLTVQPRSLAPTILSAIDTVIAVGQEPASVFTELSEALGQHPTALPPVTAQPGEVMLWRRSGDTPPLRFRPSPSQTERRRHRRKYAEGELEPDRSFYFRGPQGALNLRAQNLQLFKQLADGVDDTTWLYHLHQGDYSRWFAEAIKDETLADQVRHIETSSPTSADESRAQIKAAIDQRYTSPVD
jgi:HAD superfamily hydrolase (TIGR01484 family)